MFSKAFGYAVRAVTYIAIHGSGGHKIGLLELSESLEVPHHFLGKIMQDLVRHGIVDSTKGPNGGFYANDSTLSTVLTDILKITDGSLVFEQCALGLHRCNASRPCLVHHDFASCKNAMISVLASRTIASLTEKVLSEQVFFK
ncbi:MAG: Rrf2 family transcriptional regulator [Saprospiraceae bacterium]|nr:Rrf2 family transcriptional regulator [Saprospiraceae bacterium]